MAKPSGDPFQDLCTMIGLMTLTWAWAENTLAITIGVINEQAGPIEGYPEAPLSLKKRIACLKVALRDIASLKSLQEEGRALAVRYSHLGRRRHDLTHGAAWQLHESDFQSANVRVIAGKYAVKDHRFNQGDAVSLNIEIAKLQDDAAAFMLKVLATFESIKS